MYIDAGESGRTIAGALLAGIDLLASAIACSAVYIDGSFMAWSIAGSRRLLLLFCVLGGAISAALAVISSTNHQFRGPK